MGQGQKNNALTVRILGRDYSVACPEGEREALLDSAEYLSRRMSAIQRHSGMRGADRVAIMAALNITRDLLDLQQRIEHREASPDESQEETNRRLAQLQLRIEAALEPAQDKTSQSDDPPQPDPEDKPSNTENSAPKTEE